MRRKKRLNSNVREDLMENVSAQASAIGGRSITLRDEILVTSSTNHSKKL